MFVVIFQIQKIIEKIVKNNRKRSTILSHRKILTIAKNRIHFLSRSLSYRTIASLLVCVKNIAKCFRCDCHPGFCACMYFATSSSRELSKFIVWLCLVLSKSFSERHKLQRFLLEKLGKTWAMTFQVTLWSPLCHLKFKCIAKEPCYWNMICY